MKCVLLIDLQLIFLTFGLEPNVSDSQKLNSLFSESEFTTLDHKITEDVNTYLPQ